MPLVFLVLLILASSRAVATAAVPADSTATASRSKFIDPGDGWFDISSFLDTGHGFVPIVVPVTEPAVGYGAGGGLVFIRRNPPVPQGGFRPPNMTMVGGMGTENGTWAAFAGHSGSWRDDQWRTLVGGVYGSIDLDFYGIGNGPLNDRPVHYELEPAGGVARAHYRLGESRVQVGLAYGIASFDVSFDDDSPPAQIAPGELNSRLAGVVPDIVYDSRDNHFTPTRGFYADVNLALFAEALGGTVDFQKINVLGLGYHPLGDALFIGLRGDASFSFDDTPFYALPYITLRGAPMLRYLGETVASAELEMRWQFWRRISAVGFVGAGAAWNEFDQFDDQESIVTGGGGLRYEIARRYGLHMGLDVARGPDNTALYVQFGSAWFRP